MGDAPGREEVKDLHSLARRGIRLLLGRQAAVQVLTFAGGIVLARTLTPAEFGIFGIATFLVTLITMLGGFGLTPSLIQRKEEITERDLQVAFTVQLALLTVTAAVLWVAAPTFVGFYPAAPPETAWVVRALALKLFLAPWRAVSAVRLERHLEYKGLAVVEVAESLSYQVVAVGMAVAGFGVWSLTAAVIVQSALGAVLVYRVAPWRVRVAFDAGVAWGLVRYGLPFQAYRIVHNAQSWVVPTVVAGLIGPEAVGFLMWASPNGKKSLLVLSSVSRVTFSHMARLQDDPGAVRASLAKYLNVLLVPAALWATLIVVAGAEVVELVYTERWVPAVPALTVYAVMANLIAVEWMVSEALNSTGRVGRTTLVVAARSAATLALATVLVAHVGFIGVPVAELAVLSVMWVVLTRGLGPGAAGYLAGSLAWLLVPSAAGVGVGLALGQLPVEGLPRVAVLLSGAGGAFALGAWLACPAWLWQKAAGAVPALGRRGRPVPQT